MNLNKKIEHMLDEHWTGTCLWLRNTAEHCDRELRKFCSANSYPYEMENFEVRSVDRKVIKKETKEILFQFDDLNTLKGTKGTRDIFPDIVFYDEFNESHDKVMGGLVVKFDNLVMSVSSPKENRFPKHIFCFGNTKSVSHPLLQSLGITEITDEVMFIIRDNKLIGIVVCPQDGGAEENLKLLNVSKDKHPCRLLLDALGTSEHSFGNKPHNEDELVFDTHLKNNKRITELIAQKYFKPEWVLTVSKNEDIFCFEIGGKFHMVHGKTIENRIMEHLKTPISYISLVPMDVYYTIDESKLNEKLKLSSKKNIVDILELIQMDYVTFECSASRTTLINCVRSRK